MLQNGRNDVTPITTIWPLTKPNSANATTDKCEIVILHGFTQNAATLLPFAQILAQLTLTSVHLVDLPGHGKNSTVKYSLEQTAYSIYETFPNAIFLGYSLGGRILFHLTKLSNKPIKALIILGSHPGLNDEITRTLRSDQDRKTASLLEGISNDVDFEIFLDNWISNELFQGLTPDQANLRSRTSNSPKMLAKALKELSLAIQEDLTPYIALSKIPIMYVYGELDLKFKAVALELQSANSAFITPFAIARAGHYPIGQYPYITAQAIASYIAKLNKEHR